MPGSDAAEGTYRNSVYTSTLTKSMLLAPMRMQMDPFRCIAKIRFFG